MEQTAKQPPESTGPDLTAKELHDLGCGRALGRYTLLRRIATGGMAEVYIARSRGISGFEKKVAIKKILPQHSHNERFIDMLVDEAKITVSLTHPNIAQVYELGLDGDDTYFIVMEYVEGRPLNRLMQRVDDRGLMTIPVEHAVHIMSEVSKGLDHAHKQKDQRGNPLSIVHRDVSPQNVLIAYQGDVKLIDFGIARAEGRAAQTSHGVIKGKLRYLAPEIAAGEEPDHRADIYCCGIVLFEMLTGEAMFAPRTDFEALEMASQARVRSPRSRNPKVPQDLDDIVMRALRRDRNERYQNAKELHTELRRFLNQHYPAFVGSELGDFMQSMFLPEIQQEQRLDALAENLAQSESPVEDALTVAVAERDFVPPSGGGNRRVYKQLVTRIHIGSDGDSAEDGDDERPAAPDEVRLAGADGGEPMALVLDRASRRQRSKSDVSGGFPRTVPLPSADDENAGDGARADREIDRIPTWGRAVEPTRLADHALVTTASGPDAQHYDAPVHTEANANLGGIEGALQHLPNRRERLSSGPAPRIPSPDVGLRSERRRGEGRSTNAEDAKRRALGWGYLLAFVAVVLGGGSLIYIGFALTDPPVPIMIPTRSAPSQEGVSPTAGGAGDEPGVAPTMETILTINVDPNVEIAVEVDGDERVSGRRPPIDVDGLAPDVVHHFRVVADGFREHEFSRVLQPGSATVIEIKLERLPDKPSSSPPIAEIAGQGGGDASEGTETEIVEPNGPSGGSHPAPPPSRVPKGILVVNARPVSTVFIDGKKRGTTPIRLKLSAGKHKVTLRGPDGEKMTTTKAVAPGKTTTFVYRWPR